MKKIKYGSRDKTKEKRNPFIDQMKEDDDDVCGAVLDSFSNQYLSYISGLVKASKTPSKPKMRTEERIQGLFQNSNLNRDKDAARDAERETKFQLKQGPINVVNKTKSKDVSPKSPKSYTDLKNSTLPLKHIKQLTQGAETGYGRKGRDKSTGSMLDKMKNFNMAKGDRNFNIKQHFNRFPTQEAEKPMREQKFDDTSIQCRSNSQRQEQMQRQSNLRKQDHGNKTGKDQTGKQFLNGLDQYLITLQSNRNISVRKNDNKVGRLNTTTLKSKNEEEIRKIEELFQENVKLRRKISKYEQKMQEVQQNMENHFIHCKRQEKSQKAKITDLTKALLRAITKVNQQKEELDTLKSELKYFGRKAQFCAEKYDQQSSDEDINEQLMKAMRPSRACSQYKLKRKGDVGQRRG